MTKFAYTVPVSTSACPPSDIKNGWLSEPLVTVSDTSLPAGSKIILPDGGSKEALIGVFRTPSQYVKEAINKPHPSDSFANLPWDVRDAVQFLSSSNDKQVLKLRAEAVDWIKGIVENKRSEESKLHSTLHPDVARVVKDFNILAFEEVCRAVGFEDEYLFAGLRQGFRLSGTIPPSGRSEMRYRPAALPESEWNGLRHQFCRAVFQRTVSSGRDEDDLCLWDVTCAERDKFWLAGPYEVKDAISEFGEGLVPARRFLVRQKGKARPIDDFSVSGTNAAVESWEKPFLQTLDELVAHIRFFQRSLYYAKGGGDCRLLGRTVDLEDAFRHLPTSPLDGGASCISVFCPQTGAPKVFRQTALPFGSVVSVHAFSRLSEAIRTVLVRAFKVVATAYVDDFSLVDRASTCASVSYSVEFLLNAFGIKFSTKDSKRVPFRPSFKILGVELLLNHWEGEELKIIVRNTQARKDELQLELDSILAQGRLTSIEAARLRGRFGFFLTGLWGRSGALFLRALEIRAANLMCGSKIGGDELFAIEAAQALIKSEPRRVDVLKDEFPFWVFTDASVETDKSGTMVAIVGGIIHYPGSSVPARYFSHRLSQSVLELWRRDAPQQPIALAETLAVVLAKVLWKKILQGKRCIFAVDNVGAVQALIKMTSPVRSLALLLRVAFLVDRFFDIAPWYQWIPSESNPADEPSRGMESKLRDSEAKPEELTDEFILNLLQRVIGMEGKDLSGSEEVLCLDQEG